MRFVALLWLAFGGGDDPDQPLSMLGRTELVCPVCRQSFTTVVIAQSNTRGGVDRDLFARALGPQPVFYRISTCPRCGYSGYPSDFGPAVVIPPDVRRKIREGPGLDLPDGFTPASDPLELGAPERYALAVQCYRWRGQSDEALAWLHLRASWVARDIGSMLSSDARLTRMLRHAERWRPTMRPEDNQVDVEMQLVARMGEAVARGEFNLYQQPYVELARALILRRHGENRRAGPILDRLAESEWFSKILREDIDRMRASIEREREQQVAAARHFDRALLARQIPADNDGAAWYLLAELSRRLGRDEDAVRGYDRALRHPRLPPDLRRWAREQKKGLIRDFPEGRGPSKPWTRPTRKPGTAPSAK